MFDPFPHGSMAQQLMWHLFQIQGRPVLDEVRRALEKDVRVQVFVEGDRPIEKVGYDAYEVCPPTLNYSNGSNIKNYYATI